jgi:hypothetical protein
MGKMFVENKIQRHDENKDGISAIPSFKHD